MYQNNDILVTLIYSNPEDKLGSSIKGFLFHKKRHISKIKIVWADKSIA